MTDIRFPEVLRDDIKINFNKVMAASKVFLHFFEGSRFSTIGVSNVNYVLTPRASRTLVRLRLALYPLPQYRTGRILTMDDFNTFDLIKVNRGIFKIHFYMKQFSSLELETEECDTLSLVSSLDDTFVSELPEYYSELSAIVPYEFAGSRDRTYDLVNFFATRITFVATTVLTFLYNICEASNSLKFFEWPYEDAPSPEADQYGKKLIEKIKKLGNDFESVFKILSNVGFLFL
jgi:hypothetical protein